ncbi:twin-arginine translocase subunit TatC [Microbispora triticiradicis]|uniref:Sec-independent protein translocase protein TatC n=3 Tax=Microbispora TaxID=2005 RepID=A0ABY3M175_9ACTN|nr:MULTISPECIES: twin-arginine translocase subunit TatC [Microbispora]RGA02610.1 twin-arginine translocase subunit TatC [Microbispora triticiradicis]TLP59711.1 twin-arginine translocase subunit TatC [Microbispora fusca]TYB63425.1 twin-arginine translocase subunit TatC [Microbispora tritici]GLW23155.1 sec-independent protein translocase protein TatC [Microbispora amethystogenes]
MALLKRSTPVVTSEDGRMTLMEHLRELRNRLVKAILAVVVGTAVGFIYFEPIWNFLKQPYCRLPQAHQFNKDQCILVVNGVFDSFFVNLKVAVMFGLVVSAVFWIYQLWAFVTPGLYQNERRYTVAFLGLSVPLFTAGAALAYITMDKGLALLLGFAPDGTLTLVSINEYLSFALAMLIIFGISFLMPLLLVFLNVIGVVRYRMVSKHTRMVVFLMFVFAAVATPSQDPITMLALALPMVALFFVAMAFMYFHDKKRDAADAAHARAIEEELDGPSAAADSASVDARD